MTRTLPALHEGHAPFHLHQAFADALDAYEDWLPGQPEPVVLLDARNVPISAIFGRMRTCFDILPSRLAAIVEGIVGAGAVVAREGGQVTYADAAIVLRAKCVDRLKRVAAAFGDEAKPTTLRRALA